MRGAFLSDPARQRAHEEALAAQRRIAEKARDEDRVGFFSECGAPMALHAKPDLVPSEIRSWVSTWQRGRVRGSALLAGPFGVGKSMSAQWAIRALWERGSWDSDETPREWRPLSKAIRIRCVDVQRAVYSDRIHQVGEAWERTGLLVIEDVRRYPESAWRIADEMHAILDARCEWGRATILTTNLLPDEFEDAYPSLASRIRASAPGVVTVVRQDLRGVA